MAITLIGTPQTGVANNGANVTLTWSTAPSTNDVTVVIVGTVAASAADVSMSTADYTRAQYFTGTGTTQPAFAVFYKRQGASPDTTAVCVNNNGNTTDTTAIGYVLRGVNTTTALDQTPPSPVAATASTNPDAPQIVTQTDGAWVVIAACSVQTIDTAVTTPSTYGNAYRVGGDDTYDHTLASATKEVATAGTENPASWTDWTTGTWSAITVAFKPEPAAIPNLVRCVITNVSA